VPSSDWLDPVLMLLGISVRREYGLFHQIVPAEIAVLLSLPDGFFLQRFLLYLRILRMKSRSQ
jgi:hypothetical protein